MTETMRQALLDPAVADLLADMEKRQAEATLPRRRREKLARERAKIRSRRLQRATFDLPPALRQRIMALAEELHLPASQLATLALMRLMQDLGSGALDLGEFKQPSRSPKFDWNLVFPEEMLAESIAAKPAADPRKKKS